jgi:hypothetical protein
VIPAPGDLDRLPRELIGELTTHLPSGEVAALCVRLLEGEDPRALDWLLPWLAGVPGARYFKDAWRPYWVRTWGSRGLLYVWSAECEPAVVAGYDDEHWRVAEMCLKVGGQRELPVTPTVGRLASHELPRVRVAAVRLLGISGDTEHVTVVRSLLEDPSPDVRRSAGRALETMASRLDLPPE